MEAGIAVITETLGRGAAETSRARTECWKVGFRFVVLSFCLGQRRINVLRRFLPYSTFSMIHSSATNKPATNSSNFKDIL